MMPKALPDHLDYPGLLVFGHVAPRRQTDPLLEQSVRNTLRRTMRIVGICGENRLEVQRFPDRPGFDIFFRQGIHHLVDRYL